MRVAHICEEFVYGGIEYLILDLCAAMQKYRVQSEVICLYGKAGIGAVMNQVPGVIPVGMNPHARIDPCGLLRLRRAILEFHPDVLHCHSYYAVFAALLLRGLGLHLPIIYTIHADLYRSRQRSNFIIQRAVQFSDRVVAVSHHTAATVEAYTNGSVRPLVILNGIDFGRVTRTDGFTRRASRDALGIDKDSLLLLMVARLTTQKDHPTLFHAFAQALPTLGNARLLVVGDGPERPYLDKLITSLGLRGKIILFGNVPDINVYLSAADIFVLSTRNEGFGICVVEACCAGIPVVATGLGPLVELCEAGLDLILTKPENIGSLRDALLSLVSPARRESMAQQLRERARLLFSIERTAEQYLGLYHEMRSHQTIAEATAAREIA